MNRRWHPWLTFAGCVLAVAVLYWAQAVLMPLALAILLTFVLAPPVTQLQRWIGRVPAVLLVVALVFSVLGTAGWAVTIQASRLAGDLPKYRDNIRQKIADIRGAGRGGTVEEVQETLKDIQHEMADPAQVGMRGQPVVVRPEQATDLWSLPAWLGATAGPLSTVGLVIVLVIFMLLEREELRGRVIGLIGHGHLAVTTRALDEAGHRVGRQLLMQALVNTIYGAGAGVGLWLIGVPYPVLWAALGAAARFIPYLGPLIAAGAPILVSLAVLPGWIQPLWVVGLFLALELCTNLVLETILYAGAAGVSQTALLIAVAFWTWLWGPMGLLLATPLTVCVVVLGKHVPGLAFLSTLMAATPALAPEVSFYQRLLARDQSEAEDLVEQHVLSQAPETVYDALLLPALNYAERDRLEGRLSDDEEGVVLEQVRELVRDAGAGGAAAPGAEVTATRAIEGAKVTVLAYPASGAADELALRMLEQLLEHDAVRLEVVGGRALPSEIVAAVRERGCTLVCIADLPPSPPSRSRYILKKLRGAVPGAKILVGRWAAPSLADEDPHALLEAGAGHVGSTLLETRDHLRQLAAAHASRAAAPASDRSAA
ncbi:MAG: AI-2E family transporter [Candidatus Methylomirabilales bacterium]